MTTGEAAQGETLSPVIRIVRRLGARKPVVDWIAAQQWLAPVERGLQRAVQAAVHAAGPRVADVLHGKWLGHPLHVVLTDVPVGAWTAAMVMDVAGHGSRRAAAGARRAIGVGLVGAVGAAITGLTDWHVVRGRRRRIGAVHGLLNTAAASLYATSWALRRDGTSGPAARTTAFAGYAVACASAYLGGHLVYDGQMGVNHAAPGAEELPDDFTLAFRDDGLPEGAARRVEVNGVRVLLVRQQGRVHALVETCSHLGGPLADGDVGPGTVRCPWHGSCFSLEDGRVLAGPSVHPQPCLDTRVVDGRIEVRRRA
jgi:nitrite reductase/ring-hydroxylating ferredoxin subunit/uncharacterized membrane protein